MDGAALDALIRRTPPVTLDEMLAAREARAARQRRMAAAHPGLPLVSLSLNIPGEYKAYPLAREAFRLALSLLERQLARAGLRAGARDVREEHTGCECVCVVDGGDADAVKRIAVGIEEAHPIGRFFDFDVIAPDGEQVRGEAFGRAVRGCIVCGKPVWECARSRAHTAEELSRRTGAALHEYFSRRFADAVAAQATRALLYEVNVTPKPGLVDRDNNGAHADMDIFTFIDSSVALTPFFRDMALAGMRGGAEPAGLLSRLRLPGQWAEDAMFAATGGVNTHKGLIFSLGILCAAAGVAKAAGSGFAAGNILALCGEIAAGVDGELVRASVAENAATHGEEVFAKFGLTGARGEAARGFPGVRDCGLPVLSGGIAAGGHPNDAGVAALLHLLARVDDTNIVSRADEGTLRAVQKKVAAALKECGGDTGDLLRFAKNLDADFIASRLSPGGSADLLALSFMLHFLESTSL